MPLLIQIDCSPHQATLEAGLGIPPRAQSLTCRRVVSRQGFGQRSQFACRMGQHFQHLPHYRPGGSN